MTVSSIQDFIAGYMSYWQKKKKLKNATIRLLKKKKTTAST